MGGRRKGAWELSCPGAAEAYLSGPQFGPGYSGYIRPAPPCPAPHTPGTSLGDSVTVLGGSQRPDHFVVYMSLDPCAPEPIKNTPQRGRDEGVRDG